MNMFVYTKTRRTNLRTIRILQYCTPILVFVLPAEHGRHIGIMPPSSSLGRRCPTCHTFGFRSITFEGMNLFQLKFTVG